MPNYTQAQRTLSIATPLGEDELLVRAVSGHEALGRPFSYDLDLVSENHAIDLNAMLGANITLRIARGPEQPPRFINGLVSRFAQGATGGSFTEYRATLVPWYWFLTRLTDCRIFQNKDVPTIAATLCRLHISTDFDHGRLAESYKPWENCVQYRESVFDFLSRIQEQEGIYYYFKHEDGKHTLVLADAPSSHDPVPGHETIPYYPAAENLQREVEHLRSWDVEMEAQSGGFTVKDFNFKTPKDDISAKLAAPKGHDLSEFEQYEYPAEYEEFAQGETLAKVRLQELHARSEIASAEGDVRMMQAGYTFALTDPTNALRPDQPREYLVTHSSIRAVQDLFQSGESQGEDLFICRVRAIPKDTTFRPPRTTPKPIIPGPQTATVVGKEGEEIDPDEHGRVRVYFHWDRWVASKADEEKAISAQEAASCWVRVSQAWAGKQWGMISIPRIGQEVVVSFLEGDPDAPLITGRVYNAVNKPPYELPAFKTVSTLKTNSSKGGEGFNEFRFEDKAGEEQIFMHAQKNLDIRVLNDRFEWIGHDRHLIVENDKFEHIKNDRHEKVDRHHHEAIGADRHLKVGGKEALHTVGSRSLKVEDDVIEEFTANQSTVVTDQRYLKADHVAIEADSNITLYVGENWIAINSEGVKIRTPGKITLDADGAIEIVSNQSTIDILASLDAITMSSGTSSVTIEAQASDVSLAGLNFSAEGTAEAKVTSPMTTVNGDGQLTVSGGVVMIN
ncbi:MAG: type VI secretion system tip protein VgrG [Phycisphaerales bacterium]|nr:type VI secretion system tip protein VgrG [Phycisphaerales bacterium]MCB9841091.1 type VI secretion system tip protein VgrG [Phycisphaeraceae bacterium]